MVVVVVVVVSLVLIWFSSCSVPSLYSTDSTRSCALFFLMSVEAEEPLALLVAFVVAIVVVVVVGVVVVVVIDSTPPISSLDMDGIGLALWCAEFEGDQPYGK